MTPHLDYANTLIRTWEHHCGIRLSVHERVSLFALVTVAAQTAAWRAQQHDAARVPHPGEGMGLWPLPVTTGGDAP